MDKQRTGERYSPEVRARAVRMVREHAGEYGSKWEAISSIAGEIGCSAETLRRWVRQAERDHGLRPGTMSMDAARIQELGPENRGRVLSKAVVGAASNLGISTSQLARVLGVSEATMSRLKCGRYDLEAGSKAYELAALFVRLSDGLDAMMANDDQASRSWMRTHNLALGAKPIDRISSVVGLTSLVNYIDARRSRI